MREQNLDFRKEEVSYLMKKWTSVESCALVGVGSIGKSNLLQHLSDVRVHKHYLGEEKAKKFRPIVIDSNMLGPLTDDEQFRCWAGYELLMHRLYLAFYPFDVLGDQAEKFHETYLQLQDGTNPLYAYMGLRYFELGLQFFLRQGVQLVFMFDEFEELLKQLPVRFFQSLRGLRDTHKKQLSFITFTREPLSILIKKFDLPTDEIEPFVELFTDNEYFVGPYNQQDSYNMVTALLKRNNVQYGEEFKHYLVAITGGFAGILRATFQVLNTHPTIFTEHETLLPKLVARKPIKTECETIWKGLTDREQNILRVAMGIGLLDNSYDTQEDISLLVFKRLLKTTNNNTIVIEPPIFRRFLQEYL
jgi:hypothetical protein